MSENTVVTGIGERVWSAAFEASPDCVKLIDPDGRLLRINRTGCETFGLHDVHAEDLSAAELYWLDLLPREVREAGREALSQAANGRTVRFPGTSIDPANGVRHWDNMLLPGTGPDHGLIVVISRDVTDHHRAAEHLRAASEVDDLTGLLNRRALLAAVDEQVQRSRTSGDGLGVLFFDLDHLKAINDRFGQAAGDAALQSLARAIRSALPAGGAVAGRWGGGEFVVSVAGVGTAAGLDALAGRVQATLAGPVRFAHHELDLAASVTAGGALLEDDVDDAHALISLADWEMAAEKRQRKGGIRVRAAQAG
ncbi:diguanylate cyclase domain-containing protein [Gordonia sp. VNK21]|uniref:sensor domain-containing diguanylate cyclase n=1 Tax=Gordonia sp. VNK21 TaxID=3382483 RepID=UPI0038D487E2